MALKRLVLESKNFVYVNHSGTSVEEMMFMGMTRDELNSAKGTFNVTWFVSTCKTLEDMLLEVDNEFSLKKEQRSIGKNISKEDSIKCVEEFYREVLPNFTQRFNGSKYSILFRKNSPSIGMLFDGLVELHMLKDYYSSGLGEKDLSPLGIVEIDEALLGKTIFRRKEISLLSYLNKYLMDCKSEFAMLFVQTSSDTSEEIISLRNVVINKDFISKLNTILDSSEPECRYTCSSVQYYI